MEIKNQYSNETIADFGILRFLLVNYRATVKTQARAPKENNRGTVIQHLVSHLHCNKSQNPAIIH
jgi:retron-type reverse transcriptase